MEWVSLRDVSDLDPFPSSVDSVQRTCLIRPSAEAAAKPSLSVVWVCCVFDLPSKATNAAAAAQDEHSLGV